MKIGIIGGGIIGLTSGVVLAEAGHEVVIYSKNRFEEMTSWAAAATGYPTKVEETERVEAWFAASNDTLEKLLNENAGVSWKTWIRYSRNDVPEIPHWWDYVYDQSILNAVDCPEGYQSGIRAHILHMHVDDYFPYMKVRFEGAGGRYEYRKIADVEEIAGDFDVLVNATGSFAHQFVKDHSVKPARGQVVVVRNPGLEDCITFEEARGIQCLYVYPRGEQCIVGGSVDKGNWNMEPDDDLTAAILEWACDFEPRLKGAEILDVRVGLRPLRPLVRLEKEILADGTPVIHNYGHGGAGYTLSWGCAQDVLQLVENA